MSRWDGMLDDDKLLQAALANDGFRQIDAKIALIARIKEQLTGYVAGELCLHCWCEGGHAEHCGRPRLALVEEK